MNMSLACAEYCFPNNDLPDFCCPYCKSGLDFPENAYAYNKEAVQCGVCNDRFYVTQHVVKTYKVEKVEK